MIQVKLRKFHPGMLEAASRAGRICREPEIPGDDGKVINVKEHLFEVGHHTTIQTADHWLGFDIEGIAIGDVDFGLHLAGPFYVSLQRSGRLCGGMFESPNISQVKDYVRCFWPDVNERNIERIAAFVKRSAEIYAENLPRAVAKVEEMIRVERPHASAQYIKLNAPKIAQEQLRTVFPVALLTALYYSINLSTLVALYKVAWSPVMKAVTQMMVEEVLKVEPALSFMFSRGSIEWSPRMPSAIIDCLSKPKNEILTSDIYFRDFLEKVVLPEPESVFPIDTLNFDPRFMGNDMVRINCFLHISLAFLGQNQRHRTIERGAPAFTGYYYLPPILVKLGLGDTMGSIMEEWLRLSWDLPQSLSSILAPYGAMVEFENSGSINGFLHELGKRTCFCAQEEAYHATRSFLRELSVKVKDKGNLLRRHFAPVCVLTGECGEGARYCRRDLKKVAEDPFPDRSV
ncbi:MAG: Thymidylate synthase [Parcubacteria group bacterium Licking1014_17]|nr:MAG: Thymidylate synthase [Parcubacteria group bacterium Licking1014_17]